LYFPFLSHCFCLAFFCPPDLDGSVFLEVFFVSEEICSVKHLSHTQDGFYSVHWCRLPSFSEARVFSKFLQAYRIRKELFKASCVVIDVLFQVNRSLSG